MSSPKFDPLDLELLDRVYNLACVYIEARNLCATEKAPAIEQEALCKQIFVLAGSGPIKFDPLCDKVLAIIAETRSNLQVSERS